jgi:hypothetical protein
VRKMGSGAARLGAPVVAVALLGVGLAFLSVTSSAVPRARATASPVGEETTSRGAISGPVGIATGAEGALWWRITTSGTASTYTGVGIGYPDAVTTRWSEAEQGRVLRAAAYLDQTPEQLQKTGVQLISYVLASVQPRPASAPMVPPPASTGPVAYTTTWSASDVAVLREVEAQYSLTAEQAQKLGVQVVSFFLATAGK